MKRLKDKNSNSIIILPDKNLEDVFLHARLEISENLQPFIEKVASLFELSVKISPQKSIYLFTEKIKISEHKMQTVTLLAAAICTLKMHPQIKMALSVHCDFVKNITQEAPSDSFNIHNLSAGDFRLTPACQLFLNQAGFEMTPTEEDQILKPHQTEVLAKNFYNLVNKLAMGA
jgi:hypothetical protein